MRYRPRRPLSAILLSLSLLAVTMAGPLASVSAANDITLEQLKSGFSSPTQVTHAGDGSNRLFVVERRGSIRAIENNGTGAVSTFLTITGQVDDGASERGLLGLAFHPNFETNRYLFVYYTRNGGDIVLARYQANPAGTLVSGASGRILLVIEHSARTNHNGGALAFGPDDGYLYIGTGDGGGSGDPGTTPRTRTRCWARSCASMSMAPVTARTGATGRPPRTPISAPSRA